MSMWKFFATIAEMSPNHGALSDGEVDDIWEWMKSKDGD